MTGTALTTYDEKWAELAKGFQSQVPQASSNSLSAKGGVFAMGEQVIGSQLCVVVLDSIWSNTYFEGKYQEGVVNAPKCYAYGRAEGEMFPHESMRQHMDWFYPQTLNRTTGEIGACGTCPKNEWGSANQGGGKACQNRDRLALLPAGVYTPRPRSRDYDLQMYDDPTWFRDTDVTKFSLPVTSVKAWRQYAQKLVQTVQRPPFGVITCMSIVQDPKVQFRIQFDMIELAPDHLAPILMQRHIGVRDTMAEPYSPPREQDTRVQGLQRGAQPNFQRGPGLRGDIPF